MRSYSFPVVVISHVSAGAPAVPGPAASAAPTQTVKLAVGQSTSDVAAAMGQPTKILDTGTKIVYIYPDMKVTFKGGKVSDIQ